MWVLIVFATFAGGYSAATITQEFTTKESCIAAAKQVVGKLEENSYIRVSECVKK